MKQIGKAVVAFGLSITALSIGLAQSADEIIKQVSSNLNKSGWEATLVGKITNGGSTQDADIKIQVLPGSNQIVRFEFKKPAALEGNFVVVDDKEVWNYLFLTNQLVQQNRTTAKIEGVSNNLLNLGDFERIQQQTALRVAGEENSSEGPAWKLIGTPKTAGQDYASIEVLILKSDPRPVTITFKDGSGKTLGSLNLTGFKRVNLTARNLKKYPADASLVKR
jgi:outer membrane lipoprotein-sorting protein